MTLRNLSLGVFTGCAVAFAIFASPAQSQTGDAAAERCSSFNALSERHGNSAREITAKAQEQAKSMPATDVDKFLAVSEAGAKSEWEMSALARDAYRKCMHDYLAGGSAAAPQTPAPVPRQAVQQPAQQPAVQQPRTKQTQQQQRTQQKPRAAQTQRVQQEAEPAYQPVLPGLINLGIGIGLGGFR